jgi:hypothetical protein
VEGRANQLNLRTGVVHFDAAMVRIVVTFVETDPGLLTTG